MPPRPCPMWNIKETRLPPAIGIKAEAPSSLGFHFLNEFIIRQLTNGRISPSPNIADRKVSVGRCFFIRSWSITFIQTFVPPDTPRAAANVTTAVVAIKPQSVSSVPFDCLRPKSPLHNHSRLPIEQALCRP